MASTEERGRESGRVCFVSDYFFEQNVRVFFLEEKKRPVYS
jgi:hypothetical protein